jgi:hypothetical protein
MNAVIEKVKSGDGAQYERAYDVLKVGSEGFLIDVSSSSPSLIHINTLSTIFYSWVSYVLCRLASATASQGRARLLLVVLRMALATALIRHLVGIARKKIFYFPPAHLFDYSSRRCGCRGGGAGRRDGGTPSVRAFPLIGATLPEVISFLLVQMCHIRAHQACSTWLSITRPSSHPQRSSRRGSCPSYTRCRSSRGFCLCCGCSKCLP